MKVKNIDEQKRILRRDRRCFVCLQRGHRAKECNKAKNCRKCHGSHHQSICSIIQSKNENKDKPADQNVESVAAKSEGDKYDCQYQTQNDPRVAANCNGLCS